MAERSRTTRKPKAKARSKVNADAKRPSPKRRRSTPKSKPASPKTKRPSPKPKGGTRAEQKETTRTNIVEAALELFEKKGFDQTTTKAIARKAGVAEGTVFNYFPTKDDIALHFFELEVDHAIEAVRSNPRLRKAALEEKLFALIQSQIDYLAPYEHFIGASVVHALRPSSKLAFSARALALRARYLAFVEELIDESMGESRSALTWMAPNAFWIYYCGVILYWLHDDSSGKQNTLAFLDRSLQLGVAFLRSSAS